MIVAASLVTKSFSMWLIIILFIPLGPYAVRTVSANCLQAVILRNTASSKPEKCCKRNTWRSTIIYMYSGGSRRKWIIPKNVMWTFRRSGFATSIWCNFWISDKNWWSTYPSTFFQHLSKARSFGHVKSHFQLWKEIWWAYFSRELIVCWIVHRYSTFFFLARNSQLLLKIVNMMRFSFYL